MRKVTCIIKLRKAYSILVRKPEGNRPYIYGKIILEWWVGVDWIHLAEDRDQWWALMNAVMNLWVL
jgi:hypothetical protein